MAAKKKTVNIYFLIFLFFYSLYTLYQSIQHDFESSIFAPFRFEGKLFFNNWIKTNSLEFFFIRDWSTSPDSAEHPLFYFHNLDLVHFFAGFIQHVFAEGRLVLFIISLFFSICALRKIFDMHKCEENTVVGLLLIAIILPKSGLQMAPENLFIGLALFSICWHFKAMLDLCRHPEHFFRNFWQIISIVFISSCIETNLSLFLFIISILFSIKVYLFNKHLYKKFALIAFGSILSILLLRGIQIASVKYYGHEKIYKDDIMYTKKLKVESGQNLESAINFFQQRKLTFFGIGDSQGPRENFNELLKYYQSQYGQFSFYFFIIFNFLVALIMTSNKIQSRKIFSSNSYFYISYICFFICSSFLMLLITGNTILKLFFTPYGLIDLELIFRPLFLGIIPYIIYQRMKSIIALWKLRNTLTMLIVSLSIFMGRKSFYEKRNDHLGFNKALAYIPMGSNVISNFEPSIISTLRNARVAMSWFAVYPESCKFHDNNRNINMYHKIKSPDHSSHFIFLAKYPPYFVPTENLSLNSLKKNNCLSQQNHRQIYADEYYEVYMSKKI